ncbi:MAG: DUF1150 family protein [Pseudomonadota bacterium]
MADFPSYKTTEKTPIAYVRGVKRDALPEEVQGRLEGTDMVYAIADADGKVLALVDDRAKAFTLARMNDFAPVSAH